MRREQSTHLCYNRPEEGGRHEEEKYAEDLGERRRELIVSGSEAYR